MGGTESMLQKNNKDRCLHMLYVVIKKAGHKIKFSSKKYNKVKH